jgi:hypothetical protein
VGSGLRCGLCRFLPGELAGLRTKAIASLSSEILGNLPVERQSAFGVFRLETFALGRLSSRQASRQARRLLFEVGLLDPLPCGRPRQRLPPIVVLQLLSLPRRGLTRRVLDAEVAAGLVRRRLALIQIDLVAVLRLRYLYSSVDRGGFLDLVMFFVRLHWTSRSRLGPLGLLARRRRFRLLLVSLVLAVG